MLVSGGTPTEMVVLNGQSDLHAAANCATVVPISFHGPSVLHECSLVLSV